MLRIVLFFLLTLLAIEPVLAQRDPFITTPPKSIMEDMVLIPPGKFEMGCDELGLEHGAPRHSVYLEAYMIDKYEVTNKNFEEVIPDHNLRRSRFSQCDNCPVTKVTWYDAADYCHLIGKALPTEAQWEKAAGGVNGCEFPWGPEFTANSHRARGGFKLKDRAFAVGSYLPNKNNIFDMAGNVWEWVADWYGEYYYNDDILYNPKGPHKGFMKVRRGGSWSDDTDAMRVGYRDWSHPFSRSLNDVGFRCVLNLKK